MSNEERGAAREPAATSERVADTSTPRARDFIDASFADTDGWVVIHDPRLDLDGHLVHVDHVLIGDTLEVVLLDTRFMDCGLYLREHGRCETFDGVDRRLVASPLIRMTREARRLGEVLAHIDVPCGRRRAERHPRLSGYVLIDPAYRLGTAFGDARERIGIHSRDALPGMLRKRRRRQVLAGKEPLSKEALETFARAFLAYRPSARLDVREHGSRPRHGAPPRP